MPVRPRETVPFSSVVALYRYEWFFDELTINDIEDTSSDGNHVVTIGLGFVF
ncbi:MAG: hypothetical protein RBQ72_12615 [Desulfobacterium sp.]|jgi:hypothetical protein|nr:hypothetical protein [Desulfobacterium sp.]